MAKTLVYQLWPLAWGSIRTMTAFLSRIRDLAVDYIWLSPIYESPRRNHGYDVSDYYDIDGRLGTMADFDEFVASAHAMGMKVILDLPIDSTSVGHNWFLTEPHRYIISEGKNPDHARKNILNDALAWQQHGQNYYLALNHPAQASLNWFNGGVLNRGLLECFKKIMGFWLHSHDVDGFRLDFTQLLNSTVDVEPKLDELLIGRRAVSVINELSNLYCKAPFLIMDLIDPNGKVCNFYGRETDVEFLTDRLLRSTGIGRAKSLDALSEKITRLSKNSKFMLNLESHDVPRFTSRSKMSGKEILEFMFSTDAQAICLYQGQELGLKNPENLRIHEILSLDSRKEYEHERTRISNETLRRESCANSRTPIPLDEYAAQESDPESTLSVVKTLISNWKN